MYIGDTMEKTKDSSLIYEGKIVKLFKDTVILDNGQEAIREVVKHAKGVSIAIKDHDGKYFVVKQYRYPLKKEMIEFCAGKVDDGENVDDAVIRECEEELGVVPTNIKKLGVIIPSCGYCDEELHLYYGEVKEYTKQHLDEDENLNVYKYSLDEIEEMIEKGIIDDSKTVSTLYFLKKEK